MGAVSPPPSSMVANHPHEGSGGGSQGHGVQQHPEPTIPMRGQEISLRPAVVLCGGANHPHEGSGGRRGRRAGPDALGQPSP